MFVSVRILTPFVLILTLIVHIIVFLIRLILLLKTISHCMFMALFYQTPEAFTQVMIKTGASERWDRRQESLIDTYFSYKFLIEILFDNKKLKQDINEVIDIISK